MRKGTRQRFKSGYEWDMKRRDINPPPKRGWRFVKNQMARRRRLESKQELNKTINEDLTDAN